MDNIIDRIRKQDEGLLKKQLDLKYKLMAENPFRFFRGTASLFYEDLQGAGLDSSPVCWLCGDLHVENFGTFKGDDKLVYFDINDFDEALLGSIIWDMARAVTSIFSAFDSLNISAREARKAAKLFLEKYTSVLAEGKARYVNPKTATGIVKSFIKKTGKIRQGNLLKKVTRGQKGKLRFKTNGKELVKTNQRTKKQLRAKFAVWMKSNDQPPNRYEVVDICFRAAGTGSMGARQYLFLIRKLNNKKKFRLIDMKQATAPAGIKYTDISQQLWSSEAERIVSIQKRMQYASPAQLSTLDFNGNTYVMEQMQPVSDKVDISIIKDRFKDVSSFMKDMALVSASAHLRSVCRDGSCTADELIAFANKKGWKEQIMEYGILYSKQIKLYYKEFCQDYTSLL